MPARSYSAALPIDLQSRQKTEGPANRFLPHESSCLEEGAVHPQNGDTAAFGAINSKTPPLFFNNEG